MRGRQRKWTVRVDSSVNYFGIVTDFGFLTTLGRLRCGKKFLKLILRGLREKHALQCGILRRKSASSVGRSNTQIECKVAGLLKLYIQTLFFLHI